MSGAPVKPDETGDRDPATGRFLPGNSGLGGGRPRGLDFRRIVQEAHGDTIEAKLGEVFDALLTAARDGDVPAAKLLLDKLCVNDPVDVNVTHANASSAQPIPPPDKLLESIEEAMRVAGQVLKTHPPKGQAPSP